MRFHVVALPHTRVAFDFEACAYTSKVRKFCKMMHGLGHTVYLYAAGDKTDAPCTEFISCLSEQQRADAVGAKPFVEASFDNNLPHWRTFNRKAAGGILSRMEKRDFICLIAGWAQHPLTAIEAFDDCMTVEFGIGYGGSFAKYRVFESYAWMHMTYGAKHHANLHDADGNFYDAVIPNYFEPELFPLEETKGDYHLFIGRIVDRKGFQIAVDVCKEKGVRLIMAGQGKAPDGIEHAGVVGPEVRAKLMGCARAVWAPTRYIEPFGGVAVEAQMCGTPVITTDWGAFAETVADGVTGFRCHLKREFGRAVERLGELASPAAIREHAMQYSVERIRHRYHDYFERLLTLWGDGWNAR